MRKLRFRKSLNTLFLTWESSPLILHSDIAIEGRPLLSRKKDAFQVTKDILFFLKKKRNCINHYISPELLYFSLSFSFIFNMLFQNQVKFTLFYSVSQLFQPEKSLSTIAQRYRACKRNFIISCFLVSCNISACITMPLFKHSNIQYINNKSDQPLW